MVRYFEYDETRGFYAVRGCWGGHTGWEILLVVHHA